MKNKIPCIYDGADPTLRGVTHVAIQTRTTPPYVAYTHSNPPQAVTTVPDGMVFIPLSTARNLFVFQKGSLADCVMD